MLDCFGGTLKLGACPVSAIVCNRSHCCIRAYPMHQIYRAQNLQPAASPLKGPQPRGARRRVKKQMRGTATGSSKPSGQGSVRECMLLLMPLTSSAKLKFLRVGFFFWSDTVPFASKQGVYQRAADDHFASVDHDALLGHVRCMAMGDRQLPETALWPSIPVHAAWQADCWR